MNSISTRLLTLLAGAVLLLAACAPRDADLRVPVRDAQGLVADSKVMWKGSEVGRVRQVHPEAGQLVVDVDLLPAYRGTLREGAVAKPMNGIFTRFVPVLEIYGGDDPAAPPLSRGAVLPEATELQSLRHGPYLAWAVAAGVLLLVGLLLRGLRRLLVLALALACLAGALWVVKQQWARHGSDLVGPETEARLEEMANATIRSPDAADAWQGIRTDVHALAREARTAGLQAATSAWAKIDSALLDRAAGLESQGNAAGARELNDLRERMGALISDR